MGIVKTRATCEPLHRQGASFTAPMRLLLENPVWLVVIAITVAVHVGFAVALYRVARDKRSP